MIVVRPSLSRGSADHGWLQTRHSFSFADYYDPQHMGFSSLRVINEDHIAGGGGFPTHGHRDMEIVTYVVTGALEHADSTGTSAVIRPGDVQRMTAGYGVEHSEFNHHKDQVAHILQIWLRPRTSGLEPGYEQKSFARELAGGGVVLVATPDGRNGTITIAQDTCLYACNAAATGSFSLAIGKQRRAWAQVISGPIVVNSVALQAGDGAAITDESTLDIRWDGPAHFLLFDLN